MLHDQVKPNETELLKIYEALSLANLLPEYSPADCALSVSGDAFYLFQHLDELDTEAKNAVGWLQRLFEFYCLLCKKERAQECA